MNILFLCIGSEKISGDSLGPIIGTLLKEKYKIPYVVLGCENTPVNGINIERYRDYINNFYPNHKVIAIDAALGQKNDIGKIKVRAGGVNAGGALGNKNKLIGDIGILGVVGQKGEGAMQTLLDAPFVRVVNLAHKIAKMIFEVFCQKQNRFTC